MSCGFKEQSLSALPWHKCSGHSGEGTVVAYLGEQPQLHREAAPATWQVGGGGALLSTGLCQLPGFLLPSTQIPEASADGEDPALHPFGWVSSHKAKGRWFDSRWRHMPGLQG